MKRYIRSGTNYTSYKDFIIYKKEDDNIFYIYTEPKGKGRITFHNEQEAKEYIDKLVGQRVEKESKQEQSAAKKNRYLLRQNMQTSAISYLSSSNRWVFQCNTSDLKLFTKAQADEKVKYLSSRNDSYKYTIKSL